MLGSIQSLRLQLEIRRMRQHVKQLTEDAGISMDRSCMVLWKMFFFDWSDFWCLFAAPFIVLQFWVKNSSHSFGRDPFSKLKDWAAQNPAEFEALKVNPKKLPAQIRSQGERVRELMMEPWCEIDFCGAKVSQNM